MTSAPDHRTNRGFTFVALIVIIAVLAVLAALLLPALASAKRKAQRINCVNNLKQAGLAFRLWSGDQTDRFPMEVSTNRGGTAEFDTGADTFRPFQVMSNELSTPKILVCPADIRTAAAEFVRLKNQNVSYFVGLDASGEFPRRFLDGDRNLAGNYLPENGILRLIPGEDARWTGTMHVNAGNAGFADGSVQQLSNSGVREALRSSGGHTNLWRIALPE